ncbi:YcxB family protein [Spartinivicinus poritis]|uniref:YcxB family protein n=1 Tax=Spartinivicinus poritis TaxID=2994640 RepID=A0ABT5UGP8_9GAMM|nr:YcxB family protein [Spartinivicinus sp. A2-2]MDE1465566.1 YcxB family protein [Spartinivicinus sp. A2-2]
MKAVTTDIKRLDLIRFNLAVIPRLKSTYMTVLVLTLFVFAYFCWKYGFLNSLSVWKVTVPSAVGGGLFGTLCGVIISTVSILLMSSSKKGVLGKHEYSLSSKGLYEKTVVNESLSKWDGITKVQIVGPYLLFQITGYLFHIVPKHSFDSVDEFNEFASLAAEYWRNAQSKPVI